MIINTQVYHIHYVVGILYIILGRVRILEFVVLGYIKTGSQTAHWVTKHYQRWQFGSFYMNSFKKTIIN